MRLQLLALATLIPQNGMPYPWLFLAMTGTILIGVLVVGFALLRKTLGTRSQSDSTVEKDRTPRANNAPAFMTASMQAVIQRLKDQEKELERLHRAERERAETTARLSEEVTRNMPSGLLLIGANGLINGSNPAAEQALGVRSLNFRRYTEVLGENTDLSKLIGSCLTDGTVHRREQASHTAPDGTARDLGVTISPIRRAEEKTTGAICLLSDLTELSALQKQMQLRENLAALGELSAGIAHEFKNALATISGYAQMIESQPGALDTAENAERILEQTRSITRVVTEFLRYARPLELSQEVVCLAPLLAKIIEEVHEQQPVVKISVMGQFREVCGDDALLRQALLNVVRNGAEAAAAHSDAPEVQVHGETAAREGTTEVCIRVLDNGPGISAHAKSQLFKPFFTTKVNGTGLGLAVVQKILLQHGGQIRAQNRDQGGAEFIVTLPAMQEAGEPVKSEKIAIS
jgi:signal transduction histidine kinase